MKKLLPVFLIAVILPTMQVFAKVTLRFGTTHANINGLNVILPDKAKISKGVGMAPLRLLTLESGHAVIIGQDRPQSSLIKLVEPETLKTGYDYFKTPCFLLDGQNRVVAIIGVGSDDLVTDGARLKLQAKTYVSEGVFFVPARDLCKTLGLEMTKNGSDYEITKPEPEPVKKHWTEKLVEAIPLEILIYICIGLVVMFATLFFILTPLRRIRANRGQN